MSAGRCRGNTKATLVLAVLAGAGLASVPARVRALDEDRVLLRANVDTTYNSNVLGISKELPPTVAEQFLRGRSEGDWFLGYGAGARVDLPVSRQRFQLDLSATRYDYNQYDELDYTGYNARGIWNWRVGNDWYGQINGGAAQSRQAYLSGIVVNVPALVKNYDELMDAHYALTRRWEVYGSLSASQAHYDAVEFQSANLNVTDESIGARYSSPLGNSTGVRLTFEQGEWPNQPPASSTQLANTYTQYTLAMTLDWHLTGRSQLSGDVGFTARTRAAAGGNSTVEGPSGRVTYAYSVSGKSQLQASLYQTFGPLQDPTASYARTTGLDLGFSYQATAKLALQANASHQKIDYLGQSLIPTTLQREDTYGILGLSAKYQATRTLSFAAGAQYQNRDSNIPLAAFDVYTVFVSANIEF